jgi:septum formation protein
MIILASSSPTRQALLDNASVPFTIERPLVDEKELLARHRDWAPLEAAVQLAAAKALDVSRRNPGKLVVGADQVLALENVLFSKPNDRDGCRRQLQALRGRTHQLVSGAACARDGTVIWQAADTAHLEMRSFSDTFLDTYLATVGQDCTTTVGGYKVEGPGLQLFTSIRGDHFTILGLPMLPLLAFLREANEIPS